MQHVLQHAIAVAGEANGGRFVVVAEAHGNLTDGEAIPLRDVQALDVEAEARDGGAREARHRRARGEALEAGLGVEDAGSRTACTTRLNARLMMCRVYR